MRKQPEGTEESGQAEALRRIRDAGTNKGVTTVDLSGLGLNTLPAEIGSLTALQQLNLFNNQLTTLPAEIGSLTALQKLDLYDNQLTTLPAEIGSLTALQQLYLS